MAEFFFADEHGQLPQQLDWKEVDIIYNEYTRVMTCMHEKLRTFYNLVVVKTLTERERREFGAKIEQSRLVLPGEEPELDSPQKEEESKA